MCFTEAAAKIYWVWIQSQARRASQQITDTLAALLSSTHQHGMQEPATSSIIKLKCGKL